MATTRFLSRLIGLAALILSAAMFTDKAPMIAAIELMPQDRAAIFLLGVAGVVAGLAIVLTHNVWRQGVLPLVVTLVGWLVLVRGVALLVLPDQTLARLYAGVHFADYYYLYAVIPLALGAYLTWSGFAAVAPAPSKAKANTAATPPPAAAAKPKAPASAGNRRPQRRRR